MILVDTSIWVDHLRGNDLTLAGLLNSGLALAHPCVIAELALGHLRQRDRVLEALLDLPHALTATDGEVLHFIDRHKLGGRGIGYVDVHLLASTRLTAGASLWTRDQRLQGVAEQLGLSVRLPRPI